jgi:sugar phosphate isomerase/epimerase
MKLGVLTVLMSDLPLREVLAKLKTLGVEAIELGTGNYPGNAHCNPDLLSSKRKLDEFKAMITGEGFTISALSCHGNPLHPDPAVAKAAQEVSRKTILLAEKLGVPVVNDFSGCPGDSETSKRPNWVTCAWPPDYLETLDWQWNEKVIPYWRKRAKFAADHGVRIALEMHPGFVVYSPETLLRLRAAAGDHIGANFDPSHLFWQGIDPIAAIRILSDAIFHVHGKDTKIYEMNLPMTGVLDNKSYLDERKRTWLFRTVGYGHGREFWSEFVSTLRMCRYDYVVSIEHEDALMSPFEGLSKAVEFLRGLIIRDERGTAYWA